MSGDADPPCCRFLQDVKVANEVRALSLVFLFDVPSSRPDDTQMGRALRITAGGLVYHVLNRANRRVGLFENEGEYRTFLQTMAEA